MDIVDGWAVDIWHVFVSKYLNFKIWKYKLVICFISLIRNQLKNMSYVDRSSVNIFVLFQKCKHVICWRLRCQHMTTFKVGVCWRLRRQHMTSLYFHILKFKYFETKRCHMSYSYMVEKYRVSVTANWHSVMLTSV